ncbi:FMN-dependent NADH-azoreductase [Eoetvoesiella caeni]|uniref:FMN dependent NADH:quinone oxidoreductase n=1 Tax=Eoetvoesiella caeni TaxID=645616 RepID=A0A366HEZ2_9BURK|nr:NAD(P)H-dependent oxidoreductase [Eoetvoesiella caeni]MCI2809105.1 NAD(P)H-dependent oxidoreductase [Eoetvoesiella caeni]NYT55394.1 NAD(P)H-dependent oxidoreductase [Eoetvoesiella caeni]RBP39945.1 FMN-dependent NADH-azoreductase [Eoetvoesiella caeni]
MKLLHIDSSIREENSVTRSLSAELVEQWCKIYPGVAVDRLDLAIEAPNHFNNDSLGVKYGLQDKPTERQRVENAISEKLLTQFLETDVIVMGVPLYNFTIPTQLKAWIDRLAQPGRTFKYVDGAAVGLAGGKTIIAAMARGSIYSTTEIGQAKEHQETYLKVMFGFFGITDLRFVRAEGISVSPDAMRAGVKNGHAEVAALIAEEAKVLSWKERALAS